MNPLAPINGKQHRSNQQFLHISTTCNNLKYKECHLNSNKGVVCLIVLILILPLCLDKKICDILSGGYTSLIFGCLAHFYPTDTTWNMIKSRKGSLYAVPWQNLIAFLVVPCILPHSVISWLMLVLLACMAANLTSHHIIRCFRRATQHSTTREGLTCV